MRAKLIVTSLLVIFVLFSTALLGVDYADVARTHWAYDAIMRLTDLGILSGIRGADGRYYYQGSDPLNRYQAAVLIEKMLNYVEDTYMARDPSEVPVSDDALRAKLQQLELAMTDRDGRLVQIASVLERLQSTERQIERISYERPPDNDFATIDDLDALKRQVVVLVDRISYASRDIDELSSKFAALDKALGDINESLTRQHNILRTDLTELHQKVRTNEASVSDLTSAVADLRKDMTALKVDPELAEKVAVMEKQVSDLERNLTRIMGNYVSKEVLENYITRADLSSTLRLYAGVDDLEKLERSLATMNNNLSAEIARIDDATKDLSTKLASANRLIANLAVEVEENKKAVSEIVEIGKELPALKSDVSSLRAQLNDLTRANAASFSALREGLDELDSVTRQNAEKLEDLGTLIELRFDTTFDLASKNEKAIQDVNLRIDGLESEIAATKGALEDYVKADELEDTEAFSKLAAHIGVLNNELAEKADADDLARARRTANWGIGIGTTGLLVGIAGVIIAAMAMDWIPGLF